MFETFRKFETTLAGRPLVIETGKMAQLASGSCLVRYGETVILCTVTASAKPREGVDFFPMSVDYEEKMYSVGKIPGSFQRRESRPSEKAILTSRVIDRPIRPLFPKDMRNDVTLVCTVMSVDPDCQPETTAMIGASTAIAISDIPWDGPISGVVVGLVDGKFVINPTAEEEKRSEMHVTVASTADLVDATLVAEMGSAGEAQIEGEDANADLAQAEYVGMNKQTEAHTDQWTWKAMLEWNNRFNEIHDVELMGGTEVRHVETEVLTSTAYGYDPRTLTTQPVLFPSESIAQRYPLYEEGHTENAFVSWFATGSYTLLHRYTLGASVRFDGSDVFGVAKKYRYLPLYSFSGLWRGKEEKFLQDVDWLDELSLRASYGLQGNIDKNTSPYLIGTFDKITVLPGYIENVISAETAPNPNLKWEKTKNVNVGLNLAFLKNRVRLNVDYYYRRSTDLISSRQLPLETGFASTTVNWASMENRGWEIALNTRNIVTDNFSWTTSLNMGFNTNKILNETVAENSTYPSREGYPVGALFAYKTAGLDADGYPLFVAKDGTKQTAAEFFRLNRFGASTLSAEEQRNLYTYMGTTEPECSGGFINTFEWGDWQLNANFVFNLGMKVRVQPSYSPTYFDRGLNTNHDILNRWTSANPNTNMPALMVNTPARASEFTHFSEYNTYSMLDLWVRSLNYCRLQSLRLGYKIPKRFLAPIGIASASLSLEGRNLFVVASNYDNYLDPETMGNPYAQPITRSFIFGLNVNF